MVDPTQTLTVFYNGWPVIPLANRWIQMNIAPGLGGRIMQVSLGNYPFLFVNPALAGILPEANGLSEEGTWLNFGGEKIWPAPQGWDLPGHWPGPPDPVLDSGAYTFSMNKQAVTLSSPPDPYTGLQIGRSISVSEEMAEIKISAVFTNHGQEPSAWSVWPVIQMNANHPSCEGRYRVTCPVNASSRFTHGYTVMHGLVNSPQYSRDAHGNLQVDFQYLVGKVGLDSTAGWMAYCDRQEGKVMVARYEARPGAEYPENTSVQVWAQGRGMIFSRNRVREFSADPEENPPYLEMELLGPLEQVSPGGQIFFEYRLQMCTITAGDSVVQVTDNAVIAEPLALMISGSTTTVSAKLGFFREGTVKLQLLDHNGTEFFYEEDGSWPVDPLAGLDIHIALRAKDAGRVHTAKLLLYDRHRAFVECVGQAECPPGGVMN